MKDSTHMPNIPLRGWKEQMLAGRQYLRTAERAVKRPAVFNNELIFQLAAMAMENIIAGMCQYYQRMPTDHTLTGLLSDLAQVCPVDDQLATDIGHIQAMENMCALTPARHEPPTNGTIDKALTAAMELARLADRHVKIQPDAMGPENGESPPWT